MAILIHKANNFIIGFMNKQLVQHLITFHRDKTLK